MSVIDWEQYLTEAITIFRKDFEKLNLEDRKIISKKEYNALPFEPCQIEVLDFGEGRRKILFLVHDKHLPDMMFSIHTEVKTIDESEFKKKYKFDMFTLKGFEILDFEKLFPDYRFFIISRTSMSYEPEMDSKELAQYFLKSAQQTLKDEQLYRITTTTEGLKKAIEKIPQKEVRDELMPSADAIAGALKEIKRIDDDLGKVRQLIGSATEIQDWKLLISDVGRLKEEHISRGIFESEIKRLDQRIDSLREIKFWSKRTIVDIVLAVIATISTTIVTLLATGIIKF